jgi:hypothetical protein
MVVTKWITGVNVLQATVSSCPHTAVFALLLSCRLAMLGFAGMVATERITGVNVLQATDSSCSHILWLPCCCPAGLLCWALLAWGPLSGSLESMCCTHVFIST